MRWSFESYHEVSSEFDVGKHQVRDTLNFMYMLDEFILYSKLSP